MIIVGITGGIGHGKTTLARDLAACAPAYRHWETSEVILEVANALRYAGGTVSPAADDISAINAWLGSLPDILQATIHADVEFKDLAITEQRLADTPANYTKLLEYLRLMQDRPELINLEITMDNKTQFRTLLQWLGGYFVKAVGPGVWYDEIVRRIKQDWNNGIYLAIVGGVRFPGDAERLKNAGGFIIAIKRPSLVEKDAEDLTERERGLIACDATVYNDGTLKQLNACAANIYKDLQIRRLAHIYQARAY